MIQASSRRETRHPYANAIHESFARKTIRKFCLHDRFRRLDPSYGLAVEKEPSWNRCIPGPWSIGKASHFWVAQRQRSTPTELARLAKEQEKVRLEDARRTRAHAKINDGSRCKKQKYSCEVSQGPAPATTQYEVNTRDVGISRLRGQVSAGHTTSAGMWLSPGFRCLQDPPPPPWDQPTEGSGSSKEDNPAVNLRSFGRASDPRYRMPLSRKGSDIPA